MKCPEIGDELFTWFVDSIRNIKGRIPSFLLLDVGGLVIEDLREYHASEIESGRLAPHEVLHVPKLNHGWIRNWRRMHHIFSKPLDITRLLHQAKWSILEDILK